MITIYGNDNKSKHKLVPTLFPDGTSQVWNLPEEILQAKDLTIDWRFEQEREILDIFSFCCLFNSLQRVSLHVPFFPYARQDKEISNASTFNLFMIAGLLNVLKLDRISSVDVHNPDLTRFIVDQFVNIPVEEIHKDLIYNLSEGYTRPLHVVFPDEGAQHRYPKPKESGVESILTFKKVRDQATGKILKHEAGFEHKQWSSNKFLLLDDLCDGGATFLSIAAFLKERVKDPEINLFVTHGVFSKGRKVLEDAGIRIFTTNSLPKNVDGYEV